jgi:hypothetical protein
MATDLATGRRRVFAHAGVGGLLPGRWGDVDEGPALDGWLAAGLVSATGPGGAPAPERIPQGCCGGR